MGVLVVGKQYVIELQANLPPTLPFGEGWGEVSSGLSASRII